MPDKRPRAHIISHSHQSTTNNEPSVLAAFEIVQPAATALLRVSPIPEDNIGMLAKPKRKLVESYQNVLTSIDAIASNENVTQDQIEELIQLTVEFLRRVETIPLQGVKGEIKTSPQVVAIKNYAKECADIYADKYLETRPGFKNSAALQATNAQTVSGAKEALDQRYTALDKKFSKRQRKELNYTGALMGTLASSILLVTIPIVIPLSIFLNYKAKKHETKRRKTEGKLSQVSSVRNALANLQTNLLNNIDTSETKLSLTPEEKAEKMNALKEGIHVVREALGYEAPPVTSANRRQHR